MGGLYTGIRPVHIYPTSKMVSDYSGMMVQVGRRRPGATVAAAVVTHTLISHTSSWAVLAVTGGSSMGSVCLS
jgi:hypothetical protein